MSNEQEKLEKQNRKLRKKNKSKGKIIVLLLIILLLIAALVIFLDKIAGLFGGNLSGIFFKENADKKEETPASSSSVSDTVAADAANGAGDTTTEDKKEIEMTVYVSGTTYTMDGAEVKVEDVVEKVKSVGTDNKITVKIKEDPTATDDAVTILIDALIEAGVDPTYGIKEEQS